MGQPATGGPTAGSGSLGLVFALLLGAMAIVLAPVYLAERSIAPLITGKWASGRYPTRIYATPFRIRPGKSLSPKQLQERLGRLRYTQLSALPQRQGEYHEKEGRFYVHFRGFSHPFISSTPVHAEIYIQDDQVRSIRLAPDPRGAPLVEAVLEPELLYEVSGEQKIRREPLKFHDITAEMSHALIAVEDRRFYRHTGLDLRGILRAAFRNVSKGRISEGGSTLTQQLARSLFLSPQRTLWRKMQEALIALYIEARFSKREILRMYLDTVYFGQDGPVSIMGLVAASRHFFDKHPRELTLGECALLAGMLQSPLRYNPFRFPEAALERRDIVLAAMHKEGFLAAEQLAQVKLEPLQVTRTGQPITRLADYFVSYVQSQLEEHYGDEALMTRGLTIHTTLDPWLQEQAQQVVKSVRLQAALVSLDPRNGAIRALVGGTDYLLSPFDRATQARRQPGSAFKPFVYGAALRDHPPLGRRWTLASTVADAPRSFRIARGIWRPKNYDGRYRGPVTLRRALADSLNAATVQLAAELGPTKIIDYAQSLGITSPLKPELGLALGVYEVTLLELTGAYCTFANGGFRVEPYTVEAALGPAGEVLGYHSPQPHSVLSPGEAYLMTSLLREVVLSGTAKSLKAWDLDSIAAGKTGTTDEGKDAWFIGYTPDLVSGVWTGSDLPTKLGLSGAQSALPIWAGFMRSAAQRFRKQTADLWPKPPDIVTLDVDLESGLRAKTGCAQRSSEVFLSGSEPKAYCELHSGGVLGWFKKMLHPKNEISENPSSR